MRCMSRRSTGAKRVQWMPHPYAARRMIVIGLLLATVTALSASPASAKSRTFTQCQDLSLPLVFHSFQKVPFTVSTPKNAKPKGAKVTDVNVGVRITHAYDEDVVLTLVSPSGGVVPLVVGQGGSFDDFGSGPTSCAGTLTTFDDAASNPISTAPTPFAGAFRPEQPLSLFNGGTARGAWTLTASDNAPLDNGTLHAASLTVTYSYKQPKKKK